MKFVPITSYKNTFMAQAANDTTYIFELARKGSRKLVVSAMPTSLPGGDELVSLQSVPLAIRRAARAHLGVA